jgi:polar amino acid transport system permease protein
MPDVNWFRSDVALSVLPKLIAAAVVTIPITLVAFVAALVLGAVLLAARRSRLAVIAWPAALVFDFIRSTPLLLQIYFYYFALPQIGLRVPAIGTGILALSIHYGCYVSEVYRSGLAALPAGQWDAVRALGFSRFDAFARVIVPQLIPFFVPSLGNLLISILKETPLLAAIAVADVMFVAMQYGADHFQYMEPILLAGAIFLALSAIASAIIRLLESVASRQWLTRD